METIDTNTKELTTQALATYENLKNYAITEPIHYEAASIHLKTAKELIKAIEDRRKEMTRPLDESKKKILGLFKPSIDKLSAVVSTINIQMSKFRRKQEEEARAKQAEIDKQAGEGEVFTPQVEVEIPKTEVKVRKVWKFKVVDKDKIDKKFLIPDEKTIRELVSKLHEKTVDIVGGIEVFYEETSY